MHEHKLSILETADGFGITSPYTENKIGGMAYAERH